MDEKLLKFILKCQKNYNKPDCHSFKIMIDKGTATITKSSGASKP